MTSKQPLIGLPLNETIQATPLHSLHGEQVKAEASTAVEINTIKEGSINDHFVPLPDTTKADLWKKDIDLSLFALKLRMDSEERLTQSQQNLLSTMSRYLLQEKNNQKSMLRVWKYVLLFVWLLFFSVVGYLFIDPSVGMESLPYIALSGIGVFSAQLNYMLIKFYDRRGK